MGYSRFGVKELRVGARIPTLVRGLRFNKFFSPSYNMFHSSNLFISLKTDKVAFTTYSFDLGK